MDGAPSFGVEEVVHVKWVEDDDFCDEARVDSEVRHLFDEHGVEAMSAELLGLRHYIDDEMLHDRWLFAEWGKHIASEQDRATAFEWFLHEERPDIQTRYLWIFQDVPLPRVDYKVLCLAVMGDCVARQAAAIRALSHIQDDRIRDLAFTLLKTASDSVAYGALRLFFHNYQSEDAVYVQQFPQLPQQRSDEAVL